MMYDKIGVILDQVTVMLYDERGHPTEDLPKYVRRRLVRALSELLALQAEIRDREVKA